MRTLLILSLFLFADKELLLYRDLLVQAEKSAGAASVFYKQASAITGHEKPVLLGYKAMAAFMMSKHVFNPVNKLSYFKEGRNQMEAAVKQDTSNVELVYLRFSVQSNLPSFLGYSSSLAHDKQKLLAFLQKNNNGDSDLRHRIFNFMLQCTQLSAAEKKQLYEGS